MLSSKDTSLKADLRKKSVISVVAATPGLL